MIVLDASVVIDLLLDTRGAADAIRERVRADAKGLAAPHLLDAEVGQVLRRFVLAGQLLPERAEDALQDLADLPLIRHAHGPLLGRAFELRDNATIYDGLYLALAEGLEAPLLTRDSALASAPGHRARVEVV